MHASGTLLLTRMGRRVRRESLGREADPVMLEVFNNLFMHVAEEMGIVLEHTAHSVNIKERLDFSCALFAADGSLIANAPHIPVHLGSMGDSVQSILRSKKLAPGDAYLLNTPYNGGTHLPDLTVVTPVFDARGRAAALLRREPRAPRRHRRQHAGLDAALEPHDRRGRRAVRRRADRGRRRAARSARCARCSRAGRFPARNPDQNIADLKAQLAANARGVAELERLSARFGIRTVERYMRHVQNNAAACVRAAIAALARRPLHASSSTAASESASRSASTPTQRRATVDFTGTSPASAGNFNAPTSIVRAAVLYVFRTLVRESIPLNAGCLEPLTIVLPEGCLLDPRYPAAVVAGNVETSQCITDALLAALDACAGSQGTMNNFTFGNARHQYYETLCGGAGAGPGLRGRERRAHAHDELAAHGSRGARAALPRAHPQVRDPPRLRRRGPLARRRRRRPRDRVPRADAGGDPVEPAARRAGRPRRRRAGRVRPQLRAARGRAPRGARRRRPPSSSRPATGSSSRRRAAAATGAA